jgi:hypothetical protein
LIKSIRSVQEQIPSEKAWLELEPYYNEITEGIKEYDGLSIKETSLVKMTLNMDNINNSMIIQKRTMKELTESYINLIKESNTCPTCGNRINAACLVAIERSLL